MDPRRLTASLQWTVQLQQQGKFEEAERECRQVLVEIPDHAMATHMLGMIQFRRGWTDQGLATLHRSIDLDPRNPEFRNNLAGVLGQLQRYAEARQCIVDALKLKPDFGLAHFNLGVNCEHLKELPAAEAAYRRAMALVPHHLDAQYRLGCVLHALGRYDESEECHLSVFEPAKPKPELATYPDLTDPRIVVVVTCKGRLAHLRQTLPSMLDFEYPNEYRVVAVDYADPDGSFEWCASLRHPRLAAIRVLDRATLFQKSRAFNCGANLLSSDILCFVDADSVLAAKFLQVATGLILKAGTVLAKRAATTGSFDTVGVCCVRTSVYRAVKGYDEELQGYGPEDMDFFARVRQHGTLTHFPPELYPNALAHSQKERTRFYSYKDTKDSARQIVRRLLDKRRLVNAQEYGRAQCLWASRETNFFIQNRDLVQP